jgi:Carbohydrate-selective porin, OprB family
VASDLNQFAGSQSSNRLVITVGKFAVWDWFDGNKYAHEPRSDFMNWALIDTATFDYAADSWGYTYGATVEWYQGPWIWRGCFCDLSIVPNSPELDPTFKQFQWIGEIEHRHELWGQPGKIIVTGFLSRGRMGRFDDALNLAEATGTTPDTSLVRRYASRSGIGLSVSSRSPRTSACSRARAGRTATSSLTNSLTPTGQWRPASRSPANGGAGRTTRSVWPASSTASLPYMPLILTPAVSASWSATDSCRILVQNKSSRPITASRLALGLPLWTISSL